MLLKMCRWFICDIPENAMLLRTLRTHQAGGRLPPMLEDDEHSAVLIVVEVSDPAPPTPLSMVVDVIKGNATARGG